MPKQNDLRVVRTRRMIKEAFLELMSTIGFPKITVENLAKKAFISRNTFYLHYTDKFDLLNQLEDEILDGLKKIMMDLPFEMNISKGFVGDLPFLRAYEYIEENREFFSLIMGKAGDPAFLRKLQETIKSIMLEKNMVSKLRVPERYAIALIIGVQTSVINEWLNSGMKETPGELASILISIIQDIPQKLFQVSD